MRQRMASWALSNAKKWQRWRGHTSRLFIRDITVT
jgi:hypothetical protein